MKSKLNRAITIVASMVMITLACSTFAGGNESPITPAPTKPEIVDCYPFLTPEECTNLGTHTYIVADVQVFGDCTSNAEVGVTVQGEIDFTEDSVMTIFPEPLSIYPKIEPNVYDISTDVDENLQMQTTVTFTLEGSVEQTTVKGELCLIMTFEIINDD